MCRVMLMMRVNVTSFPRPLRNMGLRFGIHLVPVRLHVQVWILHLTVNGVHTHTIDNSKL